MNKQIDTLKDIIASRDGTTRYNAALEIEQLNKKLERITKQISLARNRIENDLASVDEMLSTNKYYDNVTSLGSSVDIFSDASLISSYLTERNQIIMSMQLLSKVADIPFCVRTHLYEMDRVEKWLQI
jgi:hypothetical protein